MQAYLIKCRCTLEDRYYNEVDKFEGVGSICMGSVSFSVRGADGPESLVPICIVW